MLAGSVVLLDGARYKVQYVSSKGMLNLISDSGDVQYGVDSSSVTLVKQRTDMLQWIAAMGDFFAEMVDPLIALRSVGRNVPVLKVESSQEAAGDERESELRQAARHGNLAEVQRLLDAGRDGNLAARSSVCSMRASASTPTTKCDSPTLPAPAAAPPLHLTSHLPSPFFLCLIACPPLSSFPLCPLRRVRLRCPCRTAIPH